jgi:hypothetical protein
VPLLLSFESAKVGVGNFVTGFDVVLTCDGWSVRVRFCLLVRELLSIDGSLAPSHCASAGSLFTYSCCLVPLFFLCAQVMVL